jgi:hypothetical protein
MFQRKIGEDVVFVANGKLEAETVKILLESFGIPAFTNQESAGTTYGLTVGPLGEVDVMVPHENLDEARKVINDMRSGKLEITDDLSSSDETDDPEEG